MVQDFQIINKAVVPLHPTVPNPYVILGETPPSAKWFTVSNLKGAFFFFFFACHWLKNPNIFLPLSGRPQEKNTNSLAERGYKVSSAKAQMVETKVTYLRVQIAHGSRRLSADQVQEILQLPSSTTRKQLQAFLGLTGYCRIWIPNYGLIAQPLYESLKGRDDSIPLMWGTPQKEAEATLKQALTQAPARPRKSIPTLCP